MLADCLLDSQTLHCCHAAAPSSAAPFLVHYSVTHAWSVKGVSQLVLQRFVSCADPSGKPVELLSAVHLECLTMVRHRAVAERNGGLQRYIEMYMDKGNDDHTEDYDPWDADTNTPNTGFWFDSTFVSHVL